MTTFVRYISWGLRIALFALLFVLAVRNVEPVTVRFLLDASWQAPLALVMFVAMAIGAVLGILACLPAFVRQRRRIAGLRKELALGEREKSEPAAPPAVVDTPPQF